MASKNRTQGTTKIRHFFNSPPNVTKNELKDAIKETENTTTIMYCNFIFIYMSPKNKFDNFLFYYLKK